jgi:prepilin-type N-terminal cleavage/methylation domain-containing protein
MVRKYQTGNYPPPDALKRNNNKGFTLAEVLITLVVIGVISAITVPTIITNYQKQSIPAKLKKFYSTMNQALILSQTKNGENISNYSFETSEIRTSEPLKKFYDENFAPYLIDVKKSKIANYHLDVAFNDGTGFIAYISAPKTVHFFYCTEYKYCKIENYDGRRTFLFTLDLDKGKLITSLNSDTNLTRQQLLNYCKYGNYDNADVSKQDKRHMCARLIQVDGWRIANDYPWKQVMIN